MDFYANLEFAESALGNLYIKDIYLVSKKRVGKDIDIIADSLIRIKNGYLAYKEDVILPYSKVVVAICTLLQKEGFITSFKEEKVEGKDFNQIRDALKYLGKKAA